MTRSLLLLGGSGYFGKSVLDANRRDVVDVGIDEILILSRSASRLARSHPDLVGENVRLIDADIRTLQELPSATWTIDAAVSTQVANYESDPERQRIAIEEAAAHVCHLVRKAELKTKFMYVSSGAAYGPTTQLSGPISESELPIPYPEGSGYKAAYGAGKLAAEAHVRKLAEDGFPAVVARAFAFVGPFLPTDQHYAIAEFVTAAHAGKSIQVRTLHRVMRSYLHSDDLARALVQFTDLADDTGTVVNLGSANGIELRELAKRVASRFGVATEVIAAIPSPVDWYVPDMTLARSRFGFEERISLDQALDEMVSSISMSN